MKIKAMTLLAVLAQLSGALYAQNPLKPDSGKPKKLPGMTLVWNDEFNKDGKPDTAFWRSEKGFVRNNELQWYQLENANISKGVLVLEGKKEAIKNPGYVQGSTNWKASREYSEYTSASIQTRGKKQWQYGTFLVRARIDTSKGSWPAIWTLGVSGGWPANGEIDIMEFYRKNNIPIILANTAVSGATRGSAKWNTQTKPLADFLKADPAWPTKFHIWRMDWDETAIKLYLDDQLLNSTLISDMLNPDGKSPFQQPHYFLLNLALGSNGADPSQSKFPMKYEVDYVRVYQKTESK